MTRTNVLLTVYDRSRYLPQAIESVLAQTTPDFSLTILDDGGSKEIETIVSRYGDPRIQHIVNRPRKGVASSVFDAIRNTQQTYFAIINDDDLWRPDFLKKLIGGLERYPEAGLAFCCHGIIDGNGELLDTETYRYSAIYGRHALSEGLQSDLDALVVKKNAIPMAMGTVVRRSAVCDNLLDSAAGKHYDLWLSLIVSHLTHLAYYSPEILTLYRVHQDMETVSRSKKTYDDIIALYFSALRRGILPRFRYEFAKRLLRTIPHAALARLRH